MGLGTFGSHPKIGLTKSRDFVSTRWRQFWTRTVTWLLFHQSERSSNSIEHIQLEKMLKPSTWMLLIRVVGQCYVGIFYLNYFLKKKTKRVAPRPAIFPPSSFLMEFFSESAHLKVNWPEYSPSNIIFLILLSEDEPLWIHSKWSFREDLKKVEIVGGTRRVGHQPADRMRIYLNFFRGKSGMCH